MNQANTAEQDEIIRPKTRSIDQLVEQLFAKSIYNEDTGCYLWQGCTAGKGYGVIHWSGKQWYVHRLAYHLENPTEQLDVIRHICDTPNCWTLAHLINGTTAENVADKLAKSRHVFGSANHNAAFTEDQIREIRASTQNLHRLGEKYRVTPSTIHYIRSGKTWRHVV